MDTHFRERQSFAPLWLTVEPQMRKRIEAAIDGLVALLDQIDGDPDLEDGGDFEPTVSRPEYTGHFARHPMRGDFRDQPELCNEDGEREIDHDREEDYG
ncbi:hypothetical protein [Breoghania sp. L-A4]|uniref:hypothetical protein n=1 Tax=Breoghania sp. L-A4 TaxID=2304600 RepID=UPI000E35ABBD|nr:hypothetical protein [Breoghania sp. L-A4]AXS39703.1 hypothetical protein D1F64_06130 [Breoghania sp. L-A4]